MINDEVAKRSQFIDAVLERKERFSIVCRRHGISRQCGHKWWKRFRKKGRLGLRNGSRRSKCTTRLQQRWRARCERFRRRFPFWGAIPLRILLRARYPRRRLPGVSTIAR